MTFNPYPKDKQVNPTKPTTKPTLTPKPAKRRRYLTRHERVQYTIATEAARCPEGYLRCSRCAIPLLDHQAQRHHIVFRSQGGKTEASNLMLVCPRCHDAIHSHRSDYLTRPTLVGTYSTVVNA